MSKYITQIQKGFETLPSNFIVLILVDAIDYLQVNLDVLKYIINERGMSGIYITINRPADSMMKTLEENHINTQKIFFIDCISKTVSRGVERKENILYTTSPQNLTDIGIAISEIASSIKSPDYFLLFDSLSTLLVYNSARTVTKFSHFLTNTIRMNNLKGVIMSVEKETDKLVLRTLYVLSDKVIDLGGKQW